MTKKNNLVLDHEELGINVFEEIQEKFAASKTPIFTDRESQKRLTELAKLKLGLIDSTEDFSEEIFPLFTPEETKKLSMSIKSLDHQDMII